MRKTCRANDYRDHLRVRCTGLLVDSRALQALEESLHPTLQEGEFERQGAAVHTSQEQMVA